MTARANMYKQAPLDEWYLSKKACQYVLLPAGLKALRSSAISTVRRAENTFAKVALDLRFCERNHEPLHGLPTSSSGFNTQDRFVKDDMRPFLNSVTYQIYCMTTSAAS